MKDAYHKRGEYEDMLGLGLQWSAHHPTAVSLARYLYNSWEANREDEAGDLLDILERAWDEYGSDRPSRKNTSGAEIEICGIVNDTLANPAIERLQLSREPHHLDWPEYRYSVGCGPHDKSTIRCYRSFKTKAELAMFEHNCKEMPAWAAAAIWDGEDPTTMHWPPDYDAWKAQQPPPNPLDDPRLMTHAALRAQREAAPLFEIVEGLIPERSVNIGVGDSGLGKTPWAVLLAVCVALGEPFLGHNTVQSRVMFVDYESAGGITDTVDQICEFLGKPKGFEMDPDWFRVVTVEQSDALELAKSFGARLVIVDALRGFDAAAETKNEQAGRLITTLQLHRAAFLLIHHIRKDAADKRDRRTSLLQEDRVLTWLEAAAGSRALINQTFTRIAIDHIKDNDADLVVRGFYKGRGEFGPWKLARVYGESGEPIGYNRLMGTELLDYFDREHFNRIPKETPMSYGDVSKALGTDKNKVQNFLAACRNAQLMQSIGKPRSRARKYIFLITESNFIRNMEVNSVVSVQDSGQLPVNRTAKHIKPVAPVTSRLPGLEDWALRREWFTRKDASELGSKSAVNSEVGELIKENKLETRLTAGKIEELRLRRVVPEEPKAPENKKPCASVGLTVPNMDATVVTDQMVGVTI